MAASVVDRRAAIVSAHSTMVDRLPEILAAHAHDITFIGCPEDPLHRSTFVTSTHPIGAHAQCAQFVPRLVGRDDILARLPDWTLWGSDVDLYRTARSTLPIEAKLRILPARTREGLRILGSKTDLALLSTELGLPFPRSVVVHEPAGLEAAVEQVGFPLLLKGERGAAGEKIRMARTAQDLWADPIPEPWYPLLAQESLTGAEAAVETLFVRGRLAGWLYSEPVTRESEFGVQTATRFVGPPSDDFADTLDRLAQAAGLQGFANCSFIRLQEPTRHVLIEADMRANAWHQFGPALGVDWGALMFADDDPPRPPVGPSIAPGDDTVVHLYPRELVYARATRSWAAAAPWLTNAPGTWRMRNRRDRAINAADRRAIASARIN